MAPTNPPPDKPTGSPIQTFMDSVDIQLEFIAQLKKIDSEKITRLIGLLAGFIGHSPQKMKFIYGIAEGRSALALYDFLQQLANYENIYPITLEDTIRRYINPARENLIIAATGSGKTKGVIDYIKDAIDLQAPILLITAKAGSDAYDLVSKYEKGHVFLIEPHMGSSNKNLAALGSEFELKLAVMLNAILQELQNGERDQGAEKYYTMLDHIMKNAGLLKGIDEVRLEAWSDRVLNRRGNYVVDGVSRSGYVANAFGMRLTHLGRNVFMRDGPTTPAFLRGDAYLPITGSGNTREIIEGAKKAHARGADIFPITVNQSSELTRYMESLGYPDNIMYVPLDLTDFDMYSIGKDISKIHADKNIQTRPSVSELNSYIFTNAFIALGIDMLGVSEKFLQQKHV